MAKRIDLSKIVIDDSIYPRDKFSEFNVQRLVNAIESGARLPPIVIEAGTNRLVDGRHRYEAYVKLGQKTTMADEKSYASDAELFADAVRLNIAHGQPLQPVHIQRAVIRLTAFGYDKDAIAEIVKVPVESIERMERGFASNEQGEKVALKGGLRHLRGTTLTQEQIEHNRRFSGPKVAWQVRQLIENLRAEMYPQTPAFAADMDVLIDLWLSIKPKTKGTAA